MVPKIQSSTDLAVTLMIPGDTLAPVQSIWGLQLIRLLVTKLSLIELMYFVAISPGGWGRVGGGCIIHQFLCLNGFNRMSDSHVLCN